jgi:5-hydroxyisourate hydrolase-like protein (transthyretin family)
VRIFRLLFVLGLAVLTIGFGPDGSASATPPAPEASARVDRQVWADLAAAADHQAAFILSMREMPAAGPGSAMRAQMALEEPLAVLQRVGTVATYAVHYGANAIVVEGGPGALRFLAEWPEVAAIRPYRAGSPWETAQAPEALAATGHITGQVTGPNGTTPLPGIRVTAYRWTGGSDWQLAAFADTGADGRYDIGGLVTGIYRAKFVDLAGSYVTEYYDNKSDFNLANAFNVTDGATTPNINASLAQAGRIAGTVIAASGGAPVADIVASACQLSGGSCPILGSAVTGADGRYTIVGLPPGTYRVRFADSYPVPRYIAQYYNGQVDFNLATPVTVTAGQTTSGINASMGGYGRITGNVTGPGSIKALSGIIVDVWQYDAASATWEWVSFAETDSSGNYEASGLVTGDYRVEFSDTPGYYVTEFYNDKPNVDSADNVHVNLGYATPNINASLALASCLVGQVTLQSHATAAGYPVRVSVYPPGSNTPASTYTTALDAAGTFTMCAVPAAGTWDVAVKGSHSLGNRRANVLIPPASSPTGFCTLLEGDASDDNRVSGIDFSILATSYNKRTGEPGFDPRADFSDDGRVSGIDFSLLSTNYNRSGPIACAAVASSVTAHGQSDAPARPAGTVDLAFSPTTRTAAVGEIITFDLMAVAGTQPVNNVETYIQFNPAVLQVVDAGGNPASSIQGDTTTLNTELYNSADNSTGEIRYDAGKLSAPFPSGTFRFAVARFKVIGAASSTTVQYTSPSDVFYGGASVVGTLGSATVLASVAGTNTPTATATPTSTRTRTPTATITATSTGMPSVTATPTASVTATRTPTATVTETPIDTPTPTATVTASFTPTVRPSRRAIYLPIAFIRR